MEIKELENYKRSLTLTITMEPYFHNNGNDLFT